MGSKARWTMSRPKRGGQRVEGGRVALDADIRRRASPLSRRRRNVGYPPNARDRLRRPAGRGGRRPRGRGGQPGRHPAARQPRRQPARPRDDRDLVRHRRDDEDRRQRDGDAGGQVASGGSYDIRNQPDAISAADQRNYDTRLSLREKKKAGKSWTPEDEKALADVEAKVTTFEAAHPKQSRIAAVCRFSIVDFEVHDYV